ncbi:hypothetical protein [Polyangium sorediatum]|uniref:DUF4347 domain-containing protein n=1 Tax=Polyangium sorediatum TaxID=889274 RepID=A0ABT6NSN7_9BACT|nr:hypothetical protein [Polyangium sorediatum]MDI1431328.1 hypothetical protein [Polyangium sorediatum]
MGSEDLVSQPIAATPGDSDSAHNLVNGRHLNPIHVWAAGKGAPLRFNDNDARLPDRGGGDKPFGQDNWLVGLDFANFADLGNKLGGGQFQLPSFVCKNLMFACGPIEENQITRLAILAHGAPGGVDIDNTTGWDLKLDVATAPEMLNAGTFSKYAVPLDQILRVLAFRATVFFMCCRTAADKPGEEFLKAISARWASKEVFVVGYKTILYCGSQGKKGAFGGSCYPGARETHYGNHKYGNVVRPYETLSGWNDLVANPWATEITPHATMAWRGRIMKDGAAPLDGGSFPGQ